MLKGAFTAIVTPFKNDKINYEVLAQLIEFQIDNNIDGIVVCGTTGESATLSTREKKELISFVVKKVHKRIPVVAGTGSNNTAASIELSIYAENIGADYLLLVTPYYNKATQKGLIKHFTAIAKSVSIPCLLYNVPSRTGIDISVNTVLELSKVSNICGIKDASGNISKALEILYSINPNDNFVLLSGNDDMIVPLLSIGSKGVISVLSNVAPKDVHIMCESYLNGNVDVSKELQLKYSPLISSLFSEVNPIPVKAALKVIGFDVGEPRLPLTEIENINFETLKENIFKARLER